MVLPFIINSDYLFKKIARKYGLRLIFQCCSKLKMLNNLGKDPITKCKKSCVVYKINCEDRKMSYEAFHVNSPSVAQNCAIFGSYSN